MNPFTSIGIPEDKRDAIFQEFEQADGSINRQFAGTGLGLGFLTYEDYEASPAQTILSSSIGRRLADPLAELVKIDPKSIGVGQYQHDVDQGMLKKSLDEVVESCVNLVGVNLNTASKHLLTYVSGLGPVLAQNVVDYRKEIGGFRTEKDQLVIGAVSQKWSQWFPIVVDRQFVFLRIEAISLYNNCGVRSIFQFAFEDIFRSAGQ